RQQGDRRLVRRLRRARPRVVCADRRPRRREEPLGRRRQPPGGPAHRGGAGVSSGARSHTAPPPEGRKPITLPRLAEMKEAGEPITMITAYDYPSAQVAEEAGVDI